MFEYAIEVQLLERPHPPSQTQIDTTGIRLQAPKPDIKTQEFRANNGF
jgi:hypothetical protein